MPLSKSGSSAFGHGMRMRSLSLCKQPQMSTKTFLDCELKAHIMKDIRAQIHASGGLSRSH